MQRLPSVIALSPFRKTICIVICKPGKQRTVNQDGILDPGPYTLSKNYRVIAFMCRMGMLLDSIMTRRIATFVLKHGTISKSQMGCAGWSTETALRSLRINHIPSLRSLIDFMPHFSRWDVSSGCEWITY